ncbi:hypothetical protein [Streptomyces sp. NPDC093269]|uniref:hypothetical protein n=1 Tax=Streptomyces sp. NPDC093269 TaxID=3366038 RepID=UPI003818C211
MPAAQIVGAAVPCLFLLALLWVLTLRVRKPSEPTALGAWRSMSTEAQAAYDDAVIDGNASAKDAVRRAVEGVGRDSAFHRF